MFERHSVIRWDGGNGCRPGPLGAAFSLLLRFGRASACRHVAHGNCSPCTSGSYAGHVPAVPLSSKHGQDASGSESTLNHEGDGKPQKGSKRSPWWMNLDTPLLGLPLSLTLPVESVCKRRYMKVVQRVHLQRSTRFRAILQSSSIRSLARARCPRIPTCNHVVLLTPPPISTVSG